MLPLGEANEEKNIEFCWGHRRTTVGSNKDVNFYDSFTYDGVEYFLFDCIYMLRENQPEPDIGKIVRIWETASHKKKVKVVWFFRPIEIQNWLGDVKPLENEIFLASGEGVGVSNINSLEAICGKCEVVCISKDKRNPQQSEEDVGVADFIFFRSFDVRSCKILNKFVDTIAGIEVEKFFNLKKYHKSTTQQKPAVCGQSNVTALKNTVKDEAKVPAAISNKQTLCSSDGKAAIRPKSSIGKDGAETARISQSQVENRAKVKFSEEFSHPCASDVRPPKRRKLLVGSNEAKLVGFEEDPTKLSDPFRNATDRKAKLLESKASVSENRGKTAVRFEEDKGLKADIRIVDVTRRSDTDTDTRKWFKQQPWEERMQIAHEKGTLVLLENLNPSFTSAEVEDIVSHALHMKVDSKMLQRNAFSNRHYGQALVIFKSKDAAESAISDLNRKCLMLENERPLVARKGTLKEPGQSAKKSGHLIIDKLRFRKQRDEMKNAVSTSHYSQPNTIEYEMAIEWRALQEKSKLWWEALNKQQAKEIEELRSQLKMRHFE